ncbi:MAG: formamidopyrimidine-DNA glycosylase [Acidimicrobiia bacterium]|nr:formamidopyrimidine-DNA glycosylase [Acidimicrobiia bacterium]
MPELPDVELYLHALRSRIQDQPLERVRLASISLLKSVAPPISAVEGREVEGLRRVGKRLVFDLEGDLHLVLHLMISGRLQWKDRGANVPRRVGHAAFDFPGGTLLLTEASTKKRASLYVVEGEDGVVAHDRGGVEPLDVSGEAFATALRSANRTLKRMLTDQHVFAGIGNAYSDEILHRAGLSPVQRTKNLSDDEVAELHLAVVDVLTEWRDRLIAEVGEGWPSKVTAFRPEMAVHGKYREPCPVCGSAVQRIVYAESEVNYCPGCQTGGKALADRSLSRLLGDDWEGMT